MVGFLGVKFPVDLPITGEVSLEDTSFSIPGVFENKTWSDLFIEFVLPEIGKAIEEGIRDFFEDEEDSDFETATVTQNSDFTFSPQTEFPSAAETTEIDLLEDPNVASFVNDILRQASISVVDSGVTSVALDTNTLSSAAGLTLASTENTVPPVSDEFAVGFPISEESNFTFSSADGVIPILGAIEHGGTVTFDSEIGPVTVGNFEIGFDESRVTDNASGFFVRDTAGPGAVLFDVGTPGTFAVEGENLTLSDADLLVSSEFSDFLQNQGLASTNLSGADVGDVETNAIVKAVTTENLFG
jgi:hypothetical protein